MYFSMVACWGQYAAVEGSPSLPSSLGWAVTGVAVAPSLMGNAVVGWYWRKEKEGRKENILSDGSAWGQYAGAKGSLSSSLGKAAMLAPIRWG